MAGTCRSSLRSLLLKPWIQSKQRASLTIMVSGPVPIFVARCLTMSSTGMQRFGTAAIPTHTIGLAFLKSDWQGAVNLILRERPGEHPDVVAARKAWLEERNLDKALALMPRRVVAERCILESYKTQKGETRNALGALSTVRICAMSSVIIN